MTRTEKALELLKQTSWGNPFKRQKKRARRELINMGVIDKKNPSLWVKSEENEEIINQYFKTV